MQEKKLIGMDEILDEMGIEATSAHGARVFDVKDTFFVGHGCEYFLPPDLLDPEKAIPLPGPSPNISICG